MGTNVAAAPKDGQQQQAPNKQKQPADDLPF